MDKKGYTLEQLEDVVADELLKIGIPCNILGYKYIRRAIAYTMIDSERVHYITSGLYPSVAEDFDSTGSKVERAIRHAVEVACDRSTPEEMVRYFGNTISLRKGKPTNSEIISLVADRLARKMRLDNVR